MAKLTDCRECGQDLKGETCKNEKCVAYLCEECIKNFPVWHTPINSECKARGKKHCTCDLCF